MSAVPDPNSNDGLFGNIKDIFGGLDDLTGGNLGNLAAGAAGLEAASQQKKENTALVQPLKDVASPFINSGLDQLNGYQTLSPLQQQSLDTGVNTGNTLTGEADPLIGIGQDAFTQYKNGTLPPWQQAALDQKIATAKALNKQALGANVDSSSLGATEANIDTQSMIAQGQLLQANLATGQNAYKQGTDLQAQGGGLTKAAYDKAVSDVNQNLQNAINTTLTGLGPLQSAIQTEIAGNTALTGQLQALFGALAKSLSAGKTSSSTGLGGVSSIASGIKNLFGGNKDTSGITNAGNQAMNEANNLLGGLDTSLNFPDFAAPKVPDGQVTADEITDLPGEVAGGAGAGALASSLGGGVPAGIVSAGPITDLGAGAVGAAGAEAAATGLSSDAALAASLAPVEGAGTAAGAAAPSAFGAAANVALPAAVLTALGFGLNDSFHSTPVGQAQGSLDVSGAPQISTWSNGAGRMPTEAFKAFGSATPENIAYANQFLQPAIAAYLKTGDKNAAMQTIVGKTTRTGYPITQAAATNLFNSLFGTLGRSYGEMLDAYRTQGAS